MKTHLTTILITLAASLCIGSIQGQTLLTETTWGGVGSDVAEALIFSSGTFFSKNFCGKM
jgi:hypothetical protein